MAVEVLDQDLEKAIQLEEWKAGLGNTRTVIRYKLELTTRTDGWNMAQ